MQRFRYIILFYLMVICILPIKSYTQVNTQSVVLREVSKKLDFESRNNFSDAVIKAKKNGWAINYLNKNNARVSLMGVDMYGQPIYFTSFADPIHSVTVNTNKV